MRKQRLTEVEVAYLRVRPKLFEVCSAIQRKYGGEFDELASEANLHFMDVYNTHDRGRGTLEGDVVFRVYHRLLETKETEARRRRHLNAVEATEENIMAHDEPWFDFQDFLCGLGRDGAEVVNMIFNPPPEVDLAVVERGEPNPNNIRAAVKEYLRDVKWSLARIRDSFRDVREALID